MYQVFLVAICSFLSNAVVSQPTPSPTLFQCFEGPFTCQPVTDDNPPNECQTAPFIKQETEKVECEENFDCCSCVETICDSCKEVICNGDSSCIGNNIIINGDSNNGGGSLNCNGDISCAGVIIDGTNIGSILCSGDDSCVEISTPSGTVVDCYNGDKGCNIECGGDCSCPDASLAITNVGEIVSCGGDNSCQSSVFDFICLIDSNNGADGCSVECVGDGSCQQAVFDINGAKSFSCGGEGGCAGGNFILTSFNGGSVSCDGENGCRSANVEVSGTIDSFSCTGASVCRDGTFTIDGLTGSGSSVSCSGINGCTDSTITVTGQVSIFECSACDGSTILIDGCDSSNGCTPLCGDCNNADIEFTNNVNGLNCDGVGACHESEITIGDIGSDDTFELGCSSTDACKNANIDITITNTNINKLKTINCGAVSACEGLTLTIDASLSGNTVTLEKITCGASNSCKDATFVFTNVVLSNPIECGQASSCSGVTGV